MSKKIKLMIEEHLENIHYVDIEVENDNDLDFALDEIESKGNHPDDILYYLNREKSIKVIEHSVLEGSSCEFEVISADD